MNLARSIALAAAFAVLSSSFVCSPPHYYIAADGADKFEARSKDYPIEIITSEKPPRPFIILGIVTGVAEGSGELFPLWQKLARENGGDAIWSIESRTSQDVWYGYPNYEWRTRYHYQAKVIRYTE